MNGSLLFFFNNLLLGAGLAMDAFSVSLANGLNDPKMRKRKALLIAGTFAVFQGAMPMIGWICVHTVIQYFKAFEKLVPWIALFLLLVIGGKMLVDGIRHKGEEAAAPKVGITALLVQGVATSIDALSVGFTIAEYDLAMAFTACLLIAIVTYVICMGGLMIGRKVGTKLAGKASILGGVILIAIGIEIFVTGI